MKKFFTLLLLLGVLKGFSQNAEEYWVKWNKNYPEQDITQMLKQERHYADSVEKHPEIGLYYFRLAKYRFNAQYLNKTKPLEANVLASMKTLTKLQGGDVTVFDGLVDTEVLFKVGDEEIWMPVQKKILEALQAEAKTGDEVKLYCAYFNEHTSSKILYNTFFIAEFIK